MSGLKRSWRGCCLIVVWLLAAAGSLSAAPIDVEADQVDKSGERIEARGGVIVTGEGLLLRAEYVVYDRLSQDVWATGQCYLKDKNSECTASTIYYNTLRGDLYLEEGSVTVLNQPMRISGQSIRRYGYDYYSGQNLTYSHCLSDKPAWSLQADSIEVPIEGFATAKGAKFKLGKVPVVYVPYLLYPAKLKRQSGVLVPELGKSSDAGLYFGLPLYQVIDESRDLTVTPYYLQNRGALLAAEYRYRPDYASTGQIYFEGIFDDREGGETLTGGVNELKADQRWLLSANHSGPRLNYDINLVSTEDYFRDIGSFYVKENSASRFGSDTAWSSSTSELISRFQYGAAAHGFYAGVSAQYKQNLDQKGNRETLQELPRLKLRMAQKSLPGTPLKLSAEASAVKLVSRDNVDAVKDYAASEVSLPLSLAPYVSLRPYMQLSYRDAHLSDNSSGYRDYAADGKSYVYVDGKRYARDDYTEQWSRRGISLTTALYSPRFAGGCYHQLVPSIDWTFNSRLGDNPDASDTGGSVYPQLLTEDNWVKEDVVKLALNNYIRTPGGTAVAELGLGFNYDRLVSEWTDLVSLKFKPSTYISLEHTSEFGSADHGAYAIQAHSTTAYLNDVRGDQFWLTSDYKRSDATKLVGLGTKLILTDRIDARFEFKHDYKKKRYEYVKYGLLYAAQCWSVELACEIEPRDEYYNRLDYAADPAATTLRPVIPRETTFRLRLNLLGIGDILSTRF